MEKENYILPSMVALIIILTAQYFGGSTTLSVILGLIGLAITYYVMNMRGK